MALEHARRGGEGECGTGNVLLYYCALMGGERERERAMHEVDSTVVLVCTEGTRGNKHEGQCDGVLVWR